MVERVYGQHSICKDEKLQRKKKHDDKDEDEDEVEEKKNVRDIRKAQTRANKDNNYPGINHTIIGGAPASRHVACSPSASSLKRGKSQGLCHVKTKILKVDNTSTFTDEDFV